MPYHTHFVKQSAEAGAPSPFHVGDRTQFGHVLERSTGTSMGHVTRRGVDEGDAAASASAADVKTAGTAAAADTGAASKPAPKAHPLTAADAVLPVTDLKEPLHQDVDVFQWEEAALERAAADSAGAGAGAGADSAAASVTLPEAVQQQKMVKAEHALNPHVFLYMTPGKAAALEVELVPFVQHFGEDAAADTARAERVRSMLSGVHMPAAAVSDTAELHKFVLGALLYTPASPVVRRGEGGGVQLRRCAHRVVFVAVFLLFVVCCCFSRSSVSPRPKKPRPLKPPTRRRLRRCRRCPPSAPAR